MWEIPAFKTASHGLITMARGNWPVIGHLKVVLPVHALGPHSKPGVSPGLNNFDNLATVYVEDRPFNLSGHGRHQKIKFSILAFWSRVRLISNQIDFQPHKSFIFLIDYPDFRKSLTILHLLFITP